MTKIRLHTLNISNFKGIPFLHLEFCGRSAALYGANGLGKSSVYDAWLWLITGKDSSGSVPDDTKGFQIKPVDASGDVADRAAHTVVEAVLQIGPQRTVLRREYYERWTRKRGAPEASYDGNTTDYYINDVPRTKGEYEGWLEAVLPLRVFGLLSHTGAFAALPDAERRAVLFEMAGIGAERDMMARETRFAPLLAATEDITLPELQLQIAAERKNCNKELNILPARLDEVGRTVAGLRDIPFDQCRAQIAEIDGALEQVQGEIARAQDHSEVSRLRSEISRMQSELSVLEAENRAHRAKQEAGQPSPEAVRRELELLKLSLENAKSRMRREARDAERCEGEAEKRREQYRTLKAEKQGGAATCPTCGQPLPADKLAEARERWQSEQKRRLDNIAQDGKGYASAAKGYRQREQEAREEAARIEEQIEEKDNYLELLEATVPLEITDLPDYGERKAALRSQVEATEREIAEINAGQKDRLAPLLERKAELTDERTRLSKLAAREAQLMDAQAREAELKQRQRRMAEELEQADRMTALIEDFTRYKAGFVTDTINALFRLVQFRLFRTQVNGGVVDCCDILCGGVPYDRGLNTGARVRCGLDMIEALSRFYGASVPVFVDGAESVTDLETGEGQFIRLYVSETDRKLRFESV